MTASCLRGPGLWRGAVNTEDKRRSLSSPRPTGKRNNCTNKRTSRQGASRRRLPRKATRTGWHHRDLFPASGRAGEIQPPSWAVPGFNNAPCDQVSATSQLCHLSNIFSKAACIARVHLSTAASKPRVQPRLARECPGVCGAGVGRRRPAAGPGH